MRINARQAVIGFLIAGMAGAALFVPALSFVGTMLAPSQPTPSRKHAPQLLGEAIWARALGGRAGELQPINPFTIGRLVSCHVMAEVFDEGADRDTQHDECMKLLPAVQGIGYLSTVHMRSEGVWQDPRVPFVQIANMTRMSSTWTRAQLIDTLAERGAYGFGLVGAERAARGYFGKPAAELTVAQAALLAALLGDAQFDTRGVDPWCDPATAAGMRRRILERMRDNQVIDDATLTHANEAELGLSAPPPARQSCPG